VEEQVGRQLAKVRSGLARLIDSYQEGQGDCAILGNLR
jgi:hypothetical protein